MASTYSSLKIQLMATGDNNTTWGDVTNLNLGTALEEAIANTANVTFSSADVTLTLTNANTSQSARRARLSLIGTTGGVARNLIVPAIEKAYIVSNACADSVTIKNATGTGIAVPAGKTIWVYNNATNVVSAVNYLADLTLGTALTVPYGGTGAATLTGYVKGSGTSAFTASATIPASDISSGAALTRVDDTNVTLTLGGTPTTALLAATSLTLGWTGTLSVARGGSGAATLTGILKGNGTGAFTAVTAPTGTIVGTTDTQTLTGKTLSTTNTIDAGTAVSDTGTIDVTSVGFRGLPQNSQTASYTLALTDAGKHVSNTTGGFVIPANASIAFPIGSSVVLFNNSGSSQTISITTDTLRQAGTANTGSRTLAQYGLATCVKVTATVWVISGAGIT